jgi:hypothetical protein
MIILGIIIVLILLILVLNKKKIFDLDFVVDDMEDPLKYLPNYNQYEVDSTTCMSQFQACCG